ncbi:MAG: phytanoyl-CoA dioxygenase family protein [Firmicutes bacterium]|nr:phytanoyl-CoA dioxygenase family protein [Bacillota bacterium]
MIASQELQQYWEQGYVVLPDCLDASVLDEVESRLDYYDADHHERLLGVGKEGISRANEIAFTANLAGKDRVLAEFVGSDPFVELATRILGPNVQLYWDQAVYKRPETAQDFPWHQDTGYVPTDPAHYLTCWIPLVDATIDNGCIWVIPGSHRQGMVTHQPTALGLQCYFGPDRGVPVPVSRGSVIAFSSLLFHRSGPNVSSQMRKAYVVQFSVEHAKHALTGEEFHNGPVIARGGRRVLSSPPHDDATTNSQGDEG